MSRISLWTAALALGLLAGVILTGCYVRPYYRYYDPYYGPPPTAEFFEAPAPPPALLAEARPPAPGPDAVWLPGHWAWNGRGWWWSPGFYARAVPPYTTFEPGAWEPTPRGTFHWRPGFWR